MKDLPSLTLLLILGLPGSGKSAFASELRRRLRLAYINTDVCWFELFQRPTYSAHESIQVFELVATEASNRMKEGTSTIVEGVFASHIRVVRMKEIAHKFGAKLLIVKCYCSKQTALERLETRHKQGGPVPVPLSLWQALREKLQKWEGIEQVTSVDTENCSIEIAADLLVTNLLARP
jgi:predicted kinase